MWPFEARKYFLCTTRECVAVREFVRALPALREPVVTYSTFEEPRVAGIFVTVWFPGDRVETLALEGVRASPALDEHTQRRITEWLDSILAYA